MTDVHPDRLFPSDPGVRAIARELYASICSLPVAAMGSMPADDFIEPAARLAYEAADLSRLQIEQSPLDDLAAYEALRTGEWPGRVVPVYRADDVVDPETPGLRRSSRPAGSADGMRCLYLEGVSRRARHKARHFQALWLPRDRAPPSERAGGGTRYGREDRSFPQGLHRQGKSCRGRTVSCRHAGRDGAHERRGRAFPAHLRRSGQGRAHDAWRRGVDRDSSIRRLRPLSPRRCSLASASRMPSGSFSSRRMRWRYRASSHLSHWPCLPCRSVFRAERRTGRDGCGAFRQQIVDAGTIMQAALLQPWSNCLADLPLQSDATRRVDCAVLAALVATHEMSHDDAAMTVRQWALT